MPTPSLIAVMGPTGSGKTAVAEGLAEELGAVLVNADAFQVYRGMDIGTNKPADKAKYRLLDIVEPTEPFGVGLWVKLALDEINDAWEAQRSVVVVGGTGLYVRALFEEYSDLRPWPDTDLRTSLEVEERDNGLGQLRERLLQADPQTTVDLNNPVRVRRALERRAANGPPLEVRLPPFRKHKIALIPEVRALDQALRNRVRAMFDAGWPEETERLLKKGVPLSAPGFRAIGYESVVGFLSGDLDRTTTEDLIYAATRKYVKRQKTWLRSEPGLTETSVERLDHEGIRQALIGALRIVSSQGEK